MTTSPRDSWEKDFEEACRTQWSSGDPYWPDWWDGVKAFIRRVEAEAYERGKKAERKLNIEVAFNVTKATMEVWHEKELKRSAAEAERRTKERIRKFIEEERPGHEWCEVCSMDAPSNRHAVDKAVDEFALNILASLQHKPEEPKA